MFFLKFGKANQLLFCHVRGVSLLLATLRIFQKPEITVNHPKNKKGGKNFPKSLPLVECLVIMFLGFISTQILYLQNCK
jgi:hypothetical protein